MDEKIEHELAALLVLENRLKEKRAEIHAQLQPVRIRISELLKIKRDAN
jgi:hypothetical protein